MPARGNPRTAQLDTIAAQQMLTADAARRNLVQKYSTEKKVFTSISPMYQPYFGKVMPVMINGIRIDIPVNGQKYEVPQSFADEIEAKVMAIDRMILKQRHMANISGNLETSPGELKIF
jgi:hypothetical protein